VSAQLGISLESCRGHGSPFNCLCLHNPSCSLKCYRMYLANNSATWVWTWLL